MSDINKFECDSGDWEKEFDKVTDKLSKVTFLLNFYENSDFIDLGFKNLDNKVFIIEMFKDMIEVLNKDIVRLVGEYFDDRYKFDKN